MDRLKPGRHDGGRILPADLHSNMDRLKHQSQMVAMFALPNLHSNMDRLKQGGIVQSENYT